MAMLTAEQAAAVLGVSSASVRIYCAKGRLAGAVKRHEQRKKGQCPWLIPAESIRSFRRIPVGRPRENTFA